MQVTRGHAARGAPGERPSLASKSGLGFLSGAISRLARFLGSLS